MFTFLLVNQFALGIREIVKINVLQYTCILVFVAQQNIVHAVIKVQSLSIIAYIVNVFNFSSTYSYLYKINTLQYFNNTININNDDNNTWLDKKYIKS